MPERYAYLSFERTIELYEWMLADDENWNRVIIDGLGSEFTQERCRVAIANIRAQLNNDFGRIKIGVSFNNDTDAVLFKMKFE